MTGQNSLPIPLQLLFWECTINCNLNCAHCRRLEDNLSAPQDLSQSQAQHLINQLAELAASQPTAPILVFSGGEPLMRKDIFDLAVYARSMNLKTALATNATLIDPATAEKIKKTSIARVSVSLDAATGELHDKIRGAEKCFSQAVAGIKNLQLQSVPFQINFTLTKTNAHQLKDVHNLARSLSAAALHVFMLVPVGCGKKIPQTEMLTPAEYENTLGKIDGLQKTNQLPIKVTCAPHYQRIVRQNKSKSKISAPPANSPHSDFPPRGCLAGGGVLFVNHKGRVFPCGYLPIDCGSVLEKSLKQIYQTSAELATLRDPEKLKGKCGLCEYKIVCGGCRARAYAAGADPLAAEPYCTYIPKKND